MIKGITTIRHAAGNKEFKSLAKLFDSLGFERGTPWKTARGQGAPFKVPLGQIEFVEGLETIHADIWIEVTDLDSIRDVLVKENVKASEIRQTAWDSRFLVAEPAKGSKVLFWQKNRPSEDAIEGDLNARAAAAAAKKTYRSYACQERLKFLHRRARWRKAESMMPLLRWAA